MKEAIKLAFKTRSFYLVWLIVLTVSCGMQFVFTLYKVRFCNVYKLFVIINEGITPNTTYT
jgi:hypothetical protein